MDLIYAWDIPSLDSQTNEQMAALEEVIFPGVDLVKVGYQLFTAEGPKAAATVIALGGRVFLDLKYCDIPHTVYGAVKAACDLGVSLVNVHALGGMGMMEAAEAGARDYPGTKVVAVTLLTSLQAGHLGYLGLNVGRRQAEGPESIVDPVRDTSWLVRRLATCAEQAGLDGVVCAVSDAEAITAEWPKGLRVCPGIRPAFAPALQDQQRVATPADAVHAGATHIVLGRAVSAPPDGLQPAQALEMIKREIDGAGLVS